MHIRTAGVLALLLVSSVVSAQKVTIDSDAAGAFGKYHTYAWTAGEPAQNPLMETRIHEAVDARLAAKGFTKVDTNPDVYVASLAVGQERGELVAQGFGGLPRFGGGFGTASIQRYTVGTLVIDIYDANTKQLVWRGTAADTMSDQPKKNTQILNKALDKMFAGYPPAGTLH